MFYLRDVILSALSLSEIESFYSDDYPGSDTILKEPLWSLHSLSLSSSLIRVPSLSFAASLIAYSVAATGNEP